MFYSKVILIGLLTENPDTRYTPSGAQVTTFVLQIHPDEESGERGGAHTIEFIAIEKDALQQGQPLSKGCRLLVEGRIRTRRWKTVNGDKRSKLEIMAEHIYPLDDK